MTRPTRWTRPWLLPFVPLYAAAVGLRSTALKVGVEPAKRLAWPVVSVGNLSSGGSGKTPFVIALANLLTREGIAVDVLTRGYGRKDSRTAQVDPAGNWEQFGDEPLLIARAADVPVYVGKRRSEAGTLAESSGSRSALHLLDDGFQHRQLYRDLDIVLLSSADLADGLLPAGNLREGVNALHRATVIAVEAEEDGVVAEMVKRGLHQPIWRYRRLMLAPVLPYDSGAADQRVAFCGIAKPAQFFAGLRHAGIVVAAELAFPDHHPFQLADIDRLNTLLRNSGASAFVTTAKDRVRLGPLEAKLNAPLHVAELRIQFEDEAAVLSAIKRLLHARASVSGLQ